MKIQWIILLAIALHFSCSPEKSNLERSWILVKNEAKPNSGFIPVLRGELFHFEKDRFTVSYVASEEIIEEKYKIEDDFIKLDSSIFGKIIHLSQDSMIIEADTSSYDMHFRPLKEIYFNEKEKHRLYEMITESTLKLNDTNSKITTRFYCDTTKWGGRFENNDWLKFLVTEDQFEEITELSFNSEWWTIKEFQGKLIFSYSLGWQMYSNHFQIIKFDDSKIEGEIIHFEDNWHSAELVVENTLPQNEINLKKEFIVGDWTTQKIIKPTNDEITFYRDSFDLYDIEISYAGQLLLDDLENENLEFYFNSDSEYSIRAGTKMIRTGENWGITKDGKYIFLDSKLNGENFVEILGSEKNQLLIRKKENVSLKSKHPDAYTNVELEINLQRKTPPDNNSITN